jgi:transcriptional regulator with XRE-family HTH domain
MPPHDPHSDALGEARSVETVGQLAGLLRVLRRRQARQRDDHQLTYRELAGATGWARGVIGDYFAGKVLPPTDRFDQLIRLLGATPAEQGVLATARDRVEELRRTSGFSAAARRISTASVGLPSEAVGFTGRDTELAFVRDLVTGLSASGPMVLALDGPAGVGKSALAIHCARVVTDRFSDGTLYADLECPTCGVSALPTRVVLDKFLRALGVAREDVPADEAEAGAAFRALTATRRLLVVLDNVRDARQVRPLLAGGRGCAVLVAGRPVLATLNGATHLHLDVLSTRDSVALLGTFAQRTLTGDDHDAAELIAWQCGYLPLALRIAGARLAARPSWPVRALADRLVDPRRRLDELRHGDLQVRSVLRDGYQRLRDSHDDNDRAAAAAFPLLAQFGGRDLALEVAARLLDQPLPVAEARVERLVDARLLESTTPGRYRFQVLHRLHALELAVDTCSTGEQAVVQARAVR